MLKHGRIYLEVYTHDWEVLLKHEPVKHLIKEWKKGAAYHNVEKDDEYIRVTSDLLKNMGPTQCMHYGYVHETTNSTTNKAPSKLLAMLWLLKYSVHDEKSFNSLKTILAPDTFSEATVEPSFLQIDFFLHYILCPVVYLSSKLDDTASPINHIIMNEYVKDPTKHPQKIAEFMMYALTSAMIQLILKFRLNANFKVRHENTTEISTFLNTDKKSEKKISSTKTILRASTLYELFFAALPGIIERNVNEHWKLIFENFIPKEKLLKTKFPANTTIQNFLVRLPLVDADGDLKSVDLNRYFEAILTGCVSLKDLIGDLQYTTASDDNKDDATMTLRDHEEIDYAESQQVNRTPVKNADKIAVVLNEDTYTNVKNCIERSVESLQKKLEEKDIEKITMYNLLGTIKENSAKMFKVFDEAFDKKKKTTDRKKNADV